MHDRRQDQREDRLESQHGITTRSRQGSEMTQWDEARGGSGDWQGYVVPYRYYGPGYRGVGYYSVFYQGSDAEGEQPESDDQGRWSVRGRGSDRGRWGQGDQARMGGSGYDDQPSGRGGYAGRGPKGYQRSDERIREEVSDRLMANDDLDAADVEVKVRGGEVTLTGTVRDRGMKRLAEDLAERVMGVKDVMNQIRVQVEQETGSRSRSGSTPSRSTRSSTQPMSETDQSTANGERQPQGSGSR
jgi:osmotically-inducible protein OsmY